MSLLEELADGLWTHKQDLSLAGVVVPRRMTVARLPSGELWVHSANALSPGLRAELDALGPVRWLIAPNCFHHLYLEEWLAAYPEAQLWGPPGLLTKRADLTFAGELSEAPPPAWGDVFAVLRCGGAARMQEHDFLHRPSNTAILTDLAFNVGAEAPWLTRQAMRLNGAYGRLTPTRFFKLIVGKREPVRAHVARLLESWEFERVLVSHGEVVERDGHARLAAGYDSF